MSDVKHPSKLIWKTLWCEQICDVFHSLKIPATRCFILLWIRFAIIISVRTKNEINFMRTVRVSLHHDQCRCHWNAHYGINFVFNWIDRDRNQKIVGIFFPFFLLLLKEFLQRPKMTESLGPMAMVMVMVMVISSNWFNLHFYRTNGEW